MARHSHWHNIQLTKGKTDAKRAKVFTKLAKSITVAAKEGEGLQSAIDAARAMSMPKENIERAIARGTGGGESANLETVVYEGFAPGGVAVIIEAVTDNRNRTVSELKLIASKNGGKLVNPGAVKWMFEQRKGSDPKYVATTTATVPDEAREAFEQFMEAIEENDDVVNIFSNDL